MFSKFKNKKEWKKSGPVIQVIRIILLILIIIGFILIFTQNVWVPKLVDYILQSEGVIGQTIEAKFSCADGKTIETAFLNGPASSVDLELSDGRTLNLPQAISASGARYANADETFVFWNKGDTAFIDEEGSTTFSDCVVENSSVPAKASMANPASVNCGQKGGILKIEKGGNGGEYGLCYFDDNRACEEWAMFRGNCPVGGVKTTGFDTIDQKFCAWSGGQTLAIPDSVCTFKNGKKCPTIDFYAGKCPAS